MTAGHAAPPGPRVASSSTAIASPSPICFIDVIDSVTKVRKTNTMITAALVTTPADGRDAPT